MSHQVHLANDKLEILIKVMLWLKYELAHTGTCVHWFPMAGAVLKSYGPLRKLTFGALFSLAVSPTFMATTWCDLMFL